MLHQVLTSFLLMAVCLTVLVVTILPKPAPADTIAEGDRDDRPGTA
jgi:hypothetical protein